MPAMPATRRTLTLSMPAVAYGMPAPTKTMLWRCLRCLQLAEPSHCRCLPKPTGCLHPTKPRFGDARDACSSQNPHTVDACRCLRDAYTQRNHDSCDAYDACSSQNPHTVDACRCLRDAYTQRNHDFCDACDACSSQNPHTVDACSKHQHHSEDANGFLPICQQFPNTTTPSMRDDVCKVLRT